MGQFESIIARLGTIVDEVRASQGRHSTFHWERGTWAFVNAALYIAEHGTFPSGEDTTFATHLGEMVDRRGCPVGKSAETAQKLIEKIEQCRRKLINHPAVVQSSASTEPVIQALGDDC